MPYLLSAEKEKTVQVRSSRDSIYSSGRRAVSKSKAENQPNKHEQKVIDTEFPTNTNEYSLQNC